MEEREEEESRMAVKLAWAARRMALPFLNCGRLWEDRCRWEVDADGSQEFGFGHVRFEMPVRYPHRDIQSRGGV